MIKAKQRMTTPDPARREVAPLSTGLSGAAAVELAFLTLELLAGVACESAGVADELVGEVAAPLLQTEMSALAPQVLARARAPAWVIPRLFSISELLKT